MNNKTIKYLTAVLLSMGWFALASSAWAVSAGGTASANVVSDLGLSETTQLNFGSFIPHATLSDTVIVNGTGFRSNPGGNLTLVNDGTDTNATFTVTGFPGASYAITCPSATTLTGPGTAMALGTFVCVSASNASATLGTLDGTTGTDTVGVGGTLTVGAAQTVGAYSGSYTFTVNFN